MTDKESRLGNLHKHRYDQDFTFSVNAHEIGDLSSRQQLRAIDERILISIARSKNGGNDNITMSLSKESNYRTADRMYEKLEQEKQEGDNKKEEKKKEEEENKEKEKQKREEEKDKGKQKEEEKKEKRQNEEKNKEKQKKEEKKEKEKEKEKEKNNDK